MTRRHVSDFIKEWRKHSHQCIVCGKWTTDPGHHVVPKSRGGEDSWANVQPMCLQHHAQFHQIMGQVITFSAGHAEARIANALKWQHQFPDAFKALAPSVLEEVTFGGVPGWKAGSDEERDREIADRVGEEDAEDMLPEGGDSPA